MHRKQIENVAIYLRKSRGDEDEDVLINHRLTLTEHAKKQNWRYTIYEEGVASGDSLATRPEMNKLLGDIEKGFFDCVLVMDYDRLSRGSKAEQGYIENILRTNDTRFATPSKIYDFDNDNDDTMIEVEGFVSRLEFKIIKRRLLQGKQSRAKQGKWVNGKPPFPYVYNKETKIVTVDEEKGKVYRMIVDRYLTGKAGTQEIAVWLNKEGIPSPSNSVWHNNTIKRLLVHEFHLGTVTYGKEKWVKTSKGKRYVKSKRDRSEWYQGQGQHEQLKTIAEHKQIIQILATNNKIPKKSRAGCFPTSGLLYCKKCGKRMSYSENSRVDKKTGKVYVYTKCGKVDPFGNRCTQRGIKMDEAFYDAIYQSIINSYFKEEHLEEVQKDDNDKQMLSSLLSTKENELRALEKALGRVTEAFEMGVYDLSYFAERKKANQTKINQIKKEIAQLEIKLDKQMKRTPKELESSLETFKNSWNINTTSKQKNNSLKSVINKIIYDRERNTINFEVEYI